MAVESLLLACALPSIAMAWSLVSRAGALMKGLVFAILAATAGIGLYFYPLPAFFVLVALSLALARACDWAYASMEA